MKKIRNDRELACDANVLQKLDKVEYKAYGQTIIHFASLGQHPAYAPFPTGIGGTKQQIKQRILHIAGFSRNTSASIWKNKVISVAMAILILFFAPLTAAFASSDDVYLCKGENAVFEDMDAYFTENKGSFVLYDSAKEKYHIYNRKISKQRVSPDCTYKIYSGLIALEENVISPNNSKRVLNGTNYPFKAWNTDQHLTSALHDSVNWYFQGLDEETGIEKLQQYFHRINYGNENLSGDSNTFWMEASLEISPLEQVQLLHAMDENKLGFHNKNTGVIKNALYAGERGGSKLYGKTGTGKVNGKNINGWFIGFVKTVKTVANTSYFALQIQNNNGKANGSKSK